MSTISNLIFNGAEHRMSSPYGKRAVISTTAGNTASFHYGTDYATYGKKLPQYAIEDGEIISCGKDSAANGYALFVWVKYPRIGKKMLHYHLDSIAVKKGQKVSKGTLLGYTGMSGKATGVHLHLGVKDLKTDKYEDPEAFSKTYKPLTKYKALKKANIRKGSGVSYAVCGIVNKGAEITVTEIVKNRFGNEWGVTQYGYINLAHFEKI